MATSTLGSGTLVLAGTTSGTTTVTATAVAGTTTLTLPAATDTLVGRATTDTLTNKTLTTPSVSSPTISDGTANGVAYLNGSKVVTSGSALVFDGTNLGVGVASPSYPLDVKLANNQFILARESTSNITNGFRIGGVNNESKAVFSANSATGEVNLGAINTNYFLTFSTNGANERMRIPAAGGVQAVTTISVGNATPSSSGAGITFPATQSASTDANTLDDYEEGTWTPTDGSGAGLSINFSSPRYTKIGRLVYVNVDIIEYPVTASGAGGIIAGLPFSNLAGNVASGGLVTANAFANRSLVVTSSTTVFFYANASTGASTNAQLSGATIYGWSAVYQTT